MGARGVLGLIAVTALMGSAACGSVSAGSAGQTASASVAAELRPVRRNGRQPRAVQGWEKRRSAWPLVEYWA